MIPAIAAGNVQANAGLLDQTSAVRPGRLPVLISSPTPSGPKYQVIAGASGQAAIYTKHFHHVSVMRKVLLHGQLDELRLPTSTRQETLCSGRHHAGPLFLMPGSL